MVSPYGYLRRFDWLLLATALLLTGAGLLTVYKTGLGEGDVLVKKQIFSIILSLIAVFVLSFIDYRIFKNNSWILIVLYGVSFLSLVGVLFVGGIRGSSSWFRIGIFGLEPVEFTKIVTILLLSKYFSFRHIEMYKISHLFISGLYVALLVGVVMLQPDFGSAVILMSIWFGLIIVSGVKTRHLAVLASLMMVAGVLGWFVFLHDYQKQRILTFLDPEADPYGSGYHIGQSLIAVGSGKLFGQDLGLTSHAGLKFLPEQHTDFIFATIAEQRGLSGVLILIILFALFFWRVISIAIGASNNFSRLFASGLAIAIFVQLLINIGMNMAIVPITGLTLPLVSYGGSSLLSIFIGLGILQSIKIHAESL